MYHRYVLLARDTCVRLANAQMAGFLQIFQEEQDTHSRVSLIPWMEVMGKQDKPVSYGELVRVGFNRGVVVLGLYRSPLSNVGEKGRQVLPYVLTNPVSTLLMGRFDLAYILTVPRCTI